MEKLMYPLWLRSGETTEALRDKLLALGATLGALVPVHGVRLAVADSAVAAAADRRMESHPPLPAAMLSLWVDDAGGAAAWESLLDGVAVRRGAYLVVEAEPLPGRLRHPAAPGERVHGMCQLALLRRLPGQDREAWLSIWKDSHTRIAIDTQSTFGYRQNLVARLLGEDTLPFDAIVEENFPPAAMASDHAFYATGGDEALLQQRSAGMLSSCARFIDFAHIDVIPMSEYLIRPLG